MMAMFSHSASGGDWEDMLLADALMLVEQHKAYECFDGHDYDDGLRSFHCLAPCPICDEEAE